MIIWRAIRRLPATTLWIAMSVAFLVLAGWALTAAQPQPANGPGGVVLVK